MNNILFIFWNILILYILLDTDAVYKWAKFFRLECFKYQEFEEKQEIFQRYQYFLSSKYPNFIVSLMTCQECLAIWLNIMQFVFFSDLLGGWVAFGINCIATLYGVSIFKHLLRKTYE